MEPNIYYLIVTKKDREPEEMKMVSTEREVLTTVGNISTGMTEATPGNHKEITRIMKINTRGTITHMEVVFSGVLKLSPIPEQAQC